MAIQSVIKTYSRICTIALFVISGCNVLMPQSSTSYGHGTAVGDVVLRLNEKDCLGPAPKKYRFDDDVPGSMVRVWAVSSNTDESTPGLVDKSRFSVTSLTPDKYVLEFNSPGFKPAKSQEVSIGAAN